MRWNVTVICETSKTSYERRFGEPLESRTGLNRSGLNRSDIRMKHV